MSLKITASSLFTKHALTVDSDGIRYYESTLLSGGRRFGFEQIDGVLLSPEHRLSIQVGQEVLSIPTKPGDARHHAAIDALLQVVRRAAAGA